MKTSVAVLGALVLILQLFSLSSGFRHHKVINEPGSYFEEFSSGSSQSQSTSCVNGVCKICVNGKCRTTNRKVGQSMAISGCPHAFCDDKCEGFVMVAEPDKPDSKCPMCKCKEHGLRESCDDNAGCPTQSTGCKNSLCEYPRPTGPLVKTCVFTGQCPSNELCISGMCNRPSDKAAPAHQEGVTCTWDSQCKSGYYCNEMTCFAGGEEHVEGTSCIFAASCPEGFRNCRGMTCYKE